MRHGRTFFYRTALAAFWIGTAAAQQNQCTQWTVTGTYGLAYDGIVIMTPPGASQAAPLPGAGLGIVSIDSEGAISSAGYQTVGGAMAWFPAMPGTLKVNSDCTGALNWAGGGLATVVISKGGDEINSMMLQSPMGPLVIRGNWQRISRLPNTLCSPISVFGTYTLNAHGYLMTNVAGAPQMVPSALVGTAAITRDGAVQSTATASVGGQVVAGQATNGTVQVNSNCTGTMTTAAVVQGRTLGQMRGWFVVLDGGDTLWMIDLANPVGAPITLGVAKRISHTTPSGQ